MWLYVGAHTNYVSSTVRRYLIEEICLTILPLLNTYCYWSYYYKVSNQTYSWNFKSCFEYIKLSIWKEFIHLILMFIFIFLSKNSFFLNPNSIILIRLEILSEFLFIRQKYFYLMFDHKSYHQFQFNVQYVNHSNDLMNWTLLESVYPSSYHFILHRVLTNINR